MENFICNQYDKNATCLHFLPYLLNICRKFEFLISQGRYHTCMTQFNTANDVHEHA